MPLATPIERPVTAVGIDEVRKAFEFVPLLFVVLAFQLRPVRAKARRFELDISRNQAAGIDRNVRTNLMLGQMRLCSALNYEAKAGARFRNQTCDWRLELIFGRRRTRQRELRL